MQQFFDARFKRPSAYTPPVSNVSSDSIVPLDHTSRWSDSERITPKEPNADDPSTSSSLLPAIVSSNSFINKAKFPIDDVINSKIHLWHGNPWNLEVDAVVNSTNENLEQEHSSPGLHASAGPRLAEECSTLSSCRTGTVFITNAYNLPARKVLHTVDPKYSEKYLSAAENALSHCYRSCLELLVDEGLKSIAMGCIYKEEKSYPRESAAHVAIRTVRRFLEGQKGSVSAVVFCISSTTDIEIYERLLPLYFPRDELEVEIANSKLPADVGDSTGEAFRDERTIRIKELPRKIESNPAKILSGSIVSDSLLVRRNSSTLDSYLDPSFMSLMKNPDQTRTEQWQKNNSFEQYNLFSTYLSKAKPLNLSDIAEMKILYLGGADSGGRPVMIVAGAHFLRRCLNVNRFVLHLVKEFQPIINKPFTIVYFHSAVSLPLRPDIGWMRKLHGILGRKFQRNLHGIYVLHGNFHFRLTVLALHLLVDNTMWKKVVYCDTLAELFRFVPRQQLTIPDYVFQHDIDVNGQIDFSEVLFIVKKC